MSYKQRKIISTLFYSLTFFAFLLIIGAVGGADMADINTIEHTSYTSGESIKIAVVCLFLGALFAFLGWWFDD